MNKLMIFLLALAFALQGTAQQPTYVLTATGLHDLAMQETTATLCHFIAGPSSLTWIQPRHEQAFTVTGLDSQWDNTTHTGTLIYHIHDGEDTGTVQVTRNGQGTWVQVDLGEGSDAIHAKYTITSMQIKG
jgi:hypothetical protein